MKARTIALAGSAMLMTMTQAAKAQEAAPPPSAAGPQAQDAAPGGLEDIVVTAQRREERLQNVPIAITATSAARLAAVGIANAQDLAVVTPALTSSQAFSYFQPRLRGIGTTANGPGIENSVAVYVDDVYYSSAASAIFSFNNVARIEVIKGPQGTLFGRNATGGLINVITKDPVHRFGGSAELTYGNYNTISYSGYVTGGLTDTVALDLAVAGRFQGDGYGRNFATGHDANRIKHDIGFRSKLLWQPFAGTEIRISGDYSENKGSYPSIRAFTDTKPVLGPNPPGGPYDVNNDTDSFNRFSGGGGSLKISQELGDLRLVSITAYRKSSNASAFDYDLTPVPAVTVDFVQRDHQLSQELQLQSGSTSRINWVVGAFYFDATASYAPTNFNVGVAQQMPGSLFFPRKQIQTIGDQGTRSIAGFGQATIPLGETTRLTGGLRYTHERREINARQFLTLVTTPNPISLIPPAQQDRTQDFNKLTYRVSLDHRLSDGVLVYVSYNRGFKAGGFNLGTPAEPAYQPEILDAFEIGAKAELFDRRVRINPSIFYYDYRNIQVPFVTGSGVIGIINGPKARIYGLDLDAEWAATDHLTINGGLTALHDRFAAFPSAVLFIPNGVGSLQVIGSATGNRLPYTASFNSTLGATYTFRLGNGGAVDLSGNWNYDSGYYTAVDNYRRQTAYHLLNASIGWTSASAGLNAKLWIKNIARETVIAFNNAATLATAVTYQAPRTFGGTIGVKF